MSPLLLHLASFAPTFGNSSLLIVDLSGLVLNAYQQRPTVTDIPEVRTSVKRDLETDL
jgi:hypothetical protein